MVRVHRSRRKDLATRSSLMILSPFFFFFFPFLAFPLCPPPLQGELNDLAREVGGASKGRREKSSRPDFFFHPRAFSSSPTSSPLLFFPPPRCCCPQPFAGPRHRCQSRFNARVAIYGVSSGRNERHKARNGKREGRLFLNERERGMVVLAKTKIETRRAAAAAATEGGRGETSL